MAILIMKIINREFVVPYFQTNPYTHIIYPYPKNSRFPNQEARQNDTAGCWLRYWWRPSRAQKGSSDLSEAP